MVATTMNKNTSVHDCPFCGIQCAVSAGEMETARQAGKDVRIACHGCGDVFDPVSGLSEDALDIAICPDCAGQFSVPPLPGDKDVSLACPLCEADVESGEMEYHRRNGKIVKKPSALSRRLSSLFGRKKPKGSKKKQAPTGDVDHQSGVSVPDMPEPDMSGPDMSGSKIDGDESSDIIIDPSVAQETPDNKPTDNSVVTRLFKPAGKKSGRADAKTVPDKDLVVPPSGKPKRKTTGKRPVLLTSLLVVLIIIGLGAVMVLSPTKPLQMIEIFTAQQIKPANFSITNAVYERVETSVGKSVVITVTITNNGDTNGMPGAMIVELLNEARQPILSWPVTTNALNIESGDSRAIVTRIFEPPSEFNDIQVTLASN